VNGRAFIRLRTLVSPLVFVAIAFTTRVLQAAEPDRTGNVVLTVRACPDPFEAALRQVLAIELGELLEEPRAGNEGLESIDIACESAAARISAQSAGGERVVHNDLPFDEFPGDAAPRAVALAALEALRAVDPTLTERIDAQRKRAPAVAPTPLKPAPPPPVANPTEPPNPTTPPFTRLLLGGVTRFFLGAPVTTAFGARLELSRRFAAPWDVGLELEGVFARRSVALGTVDGRLFSGALWFGARAGGPAWSATAALGGRFGAVLLSGTPDEPARGHDKTRFFAGPLLVLRGDGATGPLALALVAESGVAIAGAEGLAGGESALGFAGVWLALSANAGVRF